MKLIMLGCADGGQRPLPPSLSALMQHWISEEPVHKPEYLSTCQSSHSRKLVRSTLHTSFLSKSTCSRKYHSPHSSSRAHMCSTGHSKDQDIARPSLYLRRKLWKYILHSDHWLCTFRIGIVLIKCQPMYTAALLRRGKCEAKTYCLQL